MFKFIQFISDFCNLFSLIYFPPSSEGLELKSKPYKEKDMCCSPKFTQPLVDRRVVAGYSTAISCAVKGFPKVKAHVKN